jgi:hypothetical protein
MLDQKRCFAKTGSGRRDGNLGKAGEMCGSRTGMGLASADGVASEGSGINKPLDTLQKRNVFSPTFPICLSRACLGKYSVFGVKWRTFSRASQESPSERRKRPSASVLATSTVRPVHYTCRERNVPEIKYTVRKRSDNKRRVSYRSASR